MAEVPVICGPEMSNFEPLISMLEERGGVKVAEPADKLADLIKQHLTNDAERVAMTTAARNVLSLHEKAVAKTLDLVYRKNRH